MARKVSLFHDIIVPAAKYTAPKVEKLAVLSAKATSKAVSVGIKKLKAKKVRAERLKKFKTSPKYVKKFEKKPNVDPYKKVFKKK